MLLPEEVVVVLNDISEITGKISDFLEIEKLSEEQLAQLLGTFKSRNDSIVKLGEHFKSNDVSGEEKVAIKSFINEIIKIDEKNFKIIDTKLQSIKMKLKQLYNGKNLKVYSKWS